MRRGLGCFLLCLTLQVGLAGCWGHPSIERIGLLFSLGIEKAPEGKFLVTGTFPVLTRRGQDGEELIATNVAMLREGRGITLRRSGNSPERGALQQILVSADLANDGIGLYMTEFSRSPLDPPLANLAVVDGSPRELLAKAGERRRGLPSTAYLKELLSHNTGQYVPEMSVARFNILNRIPGLDPILPLLKTAREGAEIAGLALFAGDRMVGRIGARDGSLLLAMMGQLRQVDLAFPGIGEGVKEDASVMITKARSRIKTRMDRGRPAATIDLGIRAELIEYRPDRMDETKVKRKLELRLAGELRGQCLKVIHYAQSVGSDPLGLGDLIRAGHPRYVEGRDLLDVYREARVEVKVDLRIQDWGTIR